MNVAEIKLVSIHQITAQPWAGSEQAFEKASTMLHGMKEIGPVSIYARQIGDPTGGDVYQATKGFSQIVAAMKRLNWKDQVELWVIA